MAKGFRQKNYRDGKPTRRAEDCHKRPAVRATTLRGKPQYDDLNQIIKTAWNWFLQHHPTLAR
jgi:UDP-glucose 4-epimerase